MTPETRLVPIVTGLGVAIVLLHLLFAFWRIPMGWGVHCLAFFPPWTAFGLSGIALLLLHPSSSTRLIGTLSRSWLPCALWPWSRRTGYALISLLSLIPFCLLRVRLPVLGDGPMLVAALSAPGPEHYREPLTLFLVRTIYAWAGFGRQPGEGLRAYQVLSWTCGVLYVYVSLILSDIVGRTRAERTLVRLFLLTLGSIQLFFGYPENYAPLTLALLVYLYLAWRYLDGRVGLAWPAGVFGLACALHFAAGVLLPSLAYLYGFGWRRRASQRAGFWISLALPPCLFLALLLLVGFDIQGFLPQLGTVTQLVPLWTPDPVYRPHTLPSWVHVVDVVNQHLLVAPVGILVVVPVLLTAGSLVPRSPHLVLAGIVTACYAGFAALLAPLLGAFRDWDLFSPMAVPIGLLSCYLLTRCAEPKTQIRVGWTVAVVAVFHLLPWVGLNADPGRSLARSAVLLKDGSRLSAFSRGDGNDRLRALYEQVGMRREALQAGMGALDAQPQRSSHLLNVIRLMDELGDKDSVEVLLKDLIAASPGNLKARMFLGNLYLDRGNPERALQEYRQVVAVAPGYGPAHQNIGQALEKKGKRLEAIAEYRMAARLDPGFANTYFRLGVLLSEVGDSAGAIGELRNYLGRSSDEAMKEKAREGIRELGGTP